MKATARYYAFGAYVLDNGRGTLWHDGVAVTLTPKVFELLATLVAESGEVLSKDELIRRVWAGTVVEENNLARHVSTIRKALGERPGQREYIATVPGVGYRFVADVVAVHELPASCRIENGSRTDVAGPADTPVAPVADVSALPVASLPAAGRRPLSRLSMLTLVVLAVCAGAAASWFAMNRVWSNQADIGPERALKQFTYESGLQKDAAWSPDGQRIAYSSDRLGNADIWVQSISASAPPMRLTTHVANDTQPAWSPDGKFIAFRSERDSGGIYVIGVDGGGERQLTRFGTHPLWSPSGDEILFSGAEPDTAGATRFYLVNRGGGAPHTLASRVPEGFTPINAAWHPDGRVSLLGRNENNQWAMVTMAADSGPIVLSAISKRIERQLSGSGLILSNFAWAPGGRFLYFEGQSDAIRNVWRVQVDPQALEWTGAMERLTTGPGRNAGLSLSPDGRHLAFSVSTPRQSLWSYAFDSVSGTLVDAGHDITAGDADEQTMDASPDGSRLVYRALKSDRSELWERSSDAGLRLLASSADGWRYSLPRWSQDGTRIAFQRSRNEAPGLKAERAISIVAVADRREQLLMVPEGTTMVPGDWSADGSTLLGGCRTPTMVAGGTCLMPLDGGPIRQLTYDRRADLVQHRFSPNQRWISFAAVSLSDRSVTTVYVMPAEGGAWTAITDGSAYDDKPRWSRDGRALYFVSNRGGRLDVWGRRVDESTGQPQGEPFRVTAFDSGPRTLAPSLRQVGVTLSTDHMFLPMHEAIGHVWILDQVDR